MKYYIYKKRTMEWHQLGVDTIFVTSDKKIPKCIKDFCDVTDLKVKTIPIQGNGFHTSDIINKILNS